MGFIVPGYSSDGLLAKKAQVNFREDLVREHDIAAEGKVRVTSAYFTFADVRPALMLEGRVEAVEGIFPFEVREIEFLEEYLQPKVSIHYDLTNEELSKLCLYGLFDHGREGPEPPELFIDNVFEIPMKCDCTGLEPGMDEDAPLLFINIQDPFSMTTSSEESGYDIQMYFEPEVEPEVEGVMYDLEDEAEMEDDIFRIVEPERDEVVPEAEEEQAEDVEPEDDGLTNEERDLQNMFADIETTLNFKRPKAKPVEKQHVSSASFIEDEDDDRDMFMDGDDLDY